MKTSISVSEFARNLTDFLSRVAYRNERFEVRKGNRVMAEVRPVAAVVRLKDLVEAAAPLPALSQGEQDDFARDVEQLRTEAGRDRGRDRWPS